MDLVSCAADEGKLSIDIHPTNIDWHLLLRTGIVSQGLPSTGEARAVKKKITIEYGKY